MADSSNKRIAKNTLMLYIRMLLSMFVSLYTSRVVLHVLGIEDYGIYGVVGGIVTMFSFLNSSMSGATSRFLTYEIGRNDVERIRTTFSSSLIIHIGIAIIVFVLAETVGLWFFIHKLNIPIVRMDAAMWVYQCSIMSMMLAITQVPYNACIVAHERMDVYAYVELLNVGLKLIIVYLLMVGDFDKMKLYAVLVLVVGVIIMFTYRFYCLHNYQESHFRWVWNPSILKPMLMFSGWDLYGNVCGIAKNQGTTILLNVFFGPVVNAAANIATTAIGTLSGFSSNVITAFRPQIIKNYAVNRIGEMEKLLQRTIIFTSLLFGLAVFPIISEMNFVLELWLGIIPDYAVELAKIAVFSSFISNIYFVALIPLQATGNMKYASIYGGSIYLLNLIVNYMLLKCYSISPYWVWGVNCFFVVAITVANLLLIKKQIPQVQLKELLVRQIFPILFVSCLLFKMGDYLAHIGESGWMRLIIVTIVLTTVNCCIYWFFIFRNSEREFVIKNVRVALNKL